MKSERLKKGYWAKVTTWENDADNYQTNELIGLSEESVKFLMKLCERHRSTHYNEGGFGNMYDPSSEETKKYWNAIHEMLIADPAGYDLFEIDEFDEDHICDFMGRVMISLLVFLMTLKSYTFLKTSHLKM